MSRRTLTRSFPPDAARVSCIWRKSTPSGTCCQGIRCDVINLATGTIKLLTIRSTAQIPPASTSLPALRLTSPISMTHTPVSRSPAINARWIGAGPRYAGSRLGWTFNRWVSGKRRRKGPGRIRPKEAVMRRCEAFRKLGLSRGGVKGGGGCHKEKTHCYVRVRNAQKQRTYSPLSERNLLFWYCMHRHAQRFPDRLERCCDW